MYKISSKLKAVAFAMAIAGTVFNAQAVFDKRFDVCTFCCPCSTDNHMCQSQFDKLNWKTNASRPNGHMILMGSDAHRSELNNNGNFLGAYYDTLSDNYCCWTATQKADDIENNYIIANFTSTGVKPTWVSLNEISSSLWPSDAAYRAWVIAICTRLKNTYGHSVIVFSPFPNPANNASDWQSLSAVAYICVEKYLTGKDVNGSGNSVSWCQTQYQSSWNSYVNTVGVSSTKLYIVEHFANTTSTQTPAFGREGVSSAGWDNAINTRATAIHNIGFAGVCSFAWSGNQMLVTDTELIQHENTYNGNILP